MVAVSGYSHAPLGRRRQHDNEYVRVTDAALLRVCERWRARLAFKQRVADVIEVDREQTSYDEGRFALQSHFDFVVWRDEQPQFAVEFDEPHHRTDPAQMVRDAKKDRLCQLAHFPLIRAVDNSLRRVGQRPLLEWLVELWFIYHDVLDRERREANARRLAEVPDGWTADSLTDERVAWMTAFSDETRMDYAALFKQLSAAGEPAPQDPFAWARERIELHSLEHLVIPEGRWALPQGGRGWARGRLLVPVKEGVLVGEGECFDAGHLFIPDGLLSVRIAQDLATQQAAEMLDLYERGRITAIDRARAMRGSEGMHDGLLNWVHATPEQQALALARLAVRSGLPRPSEEWLREIQDEFAQSNRELEQRLREITEDAQREFGLAPVSPNTTPDQL